MLPNVYSIIQPSFKLHYWIYFIMHQALNVLHVCTTTVSGSSLQDTEFPQSQPE